MRPPSYIPSPPVLTQSLCPPPSLLCNLWQVFLNLYGVYSMEKEYAVNMKRYEGISVQVSDCTTQLVMPSHAKSFHFEIKRV